MYWKVTENRKCLYSYYIKEKIKIVKMSKAIEIIQKLKVILGMETKEVKLSEVKVADGTVLFYDGTELIVGTPLFTDAEFTVPVVDGEYETDLGKIIIKDGLVESVTPIEVPEVPEVEIEMVDAPVEETPVVPTVEDLQKVIDELIKENDDLKLKIGELEGNLKASTEKETKLKKEIEKLGNEPSVTPITMSNQSKRELTKEEKFVNSIKAIQALKNK